MTNVQVFDGLIKTNKVSNLCFDVEKTPLVDLGFGSIGSTEFAIVGNINGTKTILNTCSDRYQLVRNTDIFGRIETILKENDIDFDVCYSMDNYSLFNATYFIKGCEIDLGNADKVSPKFEVTHSYNGLAQYQIIFGFFRFICSNGMVIPYEGQEQNSFVIKGKHTDKIIESINGLMGHLTMFIENSDTYSDRYKVMADRSIENWNDRLIDVMNATGINAGKKDVNKLAIEQIMNIELNDRLNNGKKVHANDFLLYNAINEGYIYNNDVNSIKDHLRIEKDAKVLQWIYNHPVK